MNAERSDFDRALRTWFEDGPTVMSDRVVDVVADRIARQPQRRSWRLPWRLQRMNTTFKLAAGLAAAIVVAVVAWQLLPGRDGGVGGPPSPTPSAFEASPTPEATLRLVPDATLTGERYLFRPLADPADFTLAATGPDGWRGVPAWAIVGPGPGTDSPTGIGIGFLQADGVFGDPCHWDVAGSGDYLQPGDVTVGPTVDDLVTAMRANKSYTSSAATPVTIDGYAGQQLEIQLPDVDPATCDEATEDGEGHVFVFSGPVAGLYAQGPANRWLVSIIDVEGTRFIAVVNDYVGTPQGVHDAGVNVIETLDFNP